MSIIYELSRKPKKKTASHAGVLILHTRSEDLLTGNVFGILKNLNRSYGLKPFLESAIGIKFSKSEFENVEFHFWNRIPTKRKGEGSTEVDLIIQSETTLFFIEAKYGAQASSGTTNEKDRNQLKRNLDLGRIYSRDLGLEDFHLIYLTLDHYEPEIAHNYRDEPNFSWTNWGTIAKTLHKNIQSLTESEKRYAGDLIDYLAYKGFHDQPYSQPIDRMKINEKTQYKSTLSRLTDDEKLSLRKIMELHNLDLLRESHFFYWGQGFSLRTPRPKRTIFQFYPKRKFKPIDTKISNIKTLKGYIDYLQNER